MVVNTQGHGMLGRTLRVGGEPGYKKKWVRITAVVVLVLGIVGSLSGCGDANPVAGKPSVVKTVTKAPEPVATVTVQATPTKQPVPAPEKSPKSRVGESPTTDGASFIMPKEVGKNLQAAQDDLQAVTDNPFFFTDSEDASGAGRFQVLDSGWQVCSQKPKTGTKVPIDYTEIMFYVVKDFESCP
jgi:hypothetical protein